MAKFRIQTDGGCYIVQELCSVGWLFKRWKWQTLGFIGRGVWFPHKCGSRQAAADLITAAIRQRQGFRTVEYVDEEVEK